jgi:hypothetical protein
VTRADHHIADRAEGLLAYLEQHLGEAAGTVMAQERDNAALQQVYYTLRGLCYVVKHERARFRLIAEEQPA